MGRVSGILPLIFLFTSSAFAQTGEPQKTDPLFVSSVFAPEADPQLKDFNSIGPSLDGLSITNSGEIVADLGKWATSAFGGFYRFDLMGKAGQPNEGFLVRLDKKNKIQALAKFDNRKSAAVRSNGPKTFNSITECDGTLCITATYAVCGALLAVYGAESYDDLVEKVSTCSKAVTEKFGDRRVGRGRNEHVQISAFSWALKKEEPRNLSYIRRLSRGAPKGESLLARMQANEIKESRSHSDALKLAEFCKRVGISGSYNENGASRVPFKFRHRSGSVRKIKPESQPAVK